MRACLQVLVSLAATVHLGAAQDESLSINWMYTINCDQQSVNTFKESKHSWNQPDEDKTKPCVDALARVFMSSSSVTDFETARGLAARKLSPRNDETRVLTERCGVRACKTCCFEPQPIQCVFGVVILPSGFFVQNRLGKSGLCMACPQINCRDTCPDGKFALDYKFLGAVRSVPPPLGLGFLFLFR